MQTQSIIIDEYKKIRLGQLGHAMVVHSVGAQSLEIWMILSCGSCKYASCDVDYFPYDIKHQKNQHFLDILQIHTLNIFSTFHNDCAQCVVSRE